MDNTMNFNYMTRICDKLLASQETKNRQKTAASFQDNIVEKRKEAASVSETGKTGTVSTTDMSMEEYKQYIHEKISRLPMSASSAMESISVTISEKGFEAMKNDPEYEKWVIDSLKANFSFHNPWVPICGGGYSTHYFGATKEEYHGEGWYPGYQNGNGGNLFQQKAKDSFWERRIERSERYKEQYEKALEKKFQNRSLWQRSYFGDLLEPQIGIAELLFFGNPMTTGSDS